MRIDAVQNLKGLSYTGTRVLHDDLKIEVGMIRLGAVRIGTEQDNALRCAFYAFRWSEQLGQG
jgi:hypothetical protein